MIPMMNIVAWSRVVPWVDLRQAEQDLKRSGSLLIRKRVFGTETHQRLHDPGSFPSHRKRQHSSHRAPIRGKVGAGGLAPAEPHSTGALRRPTRPHPAACSRPGNAECWGVHHPAHRARRTLTPVGTVPRHRRKSGRAGGPSLASRSRMDD